jgi:hypothetical protein
MITVTFHCGGCDAVAPAIRPIYRNFEGITGKPYGFGKYVWETPEQIKPEGWTAADLIGATYCPKCTKELETPILTEAHP